MENIRETATFRETATLNENGKFYQHFGIRPILASLYGDKPEDIVVIEFRISDDQTVPPSTVHPDMKVDYWGWFDDRTQRFNMIYAKRFLLEMCFPDGIKVCEDYGQGKAYRLEIVDVIHPDYSKAKNNNK